MNYPSFQEKDDMSFKINNLVYLDKLKSKKHDIEMYTHQFLGKILIIDGEVQHVEKYQSLYHEMLVHLPMSFLSQPKSVLILGGGSLFAANECIKYSKIDRITLCDHDPLVIKLMEKHYEHAKSVLNNKRFSYIEKDAVEFLVSEKGNFDLIINDCINISVYSKKIGIDLFDLLYQNLNENGVVCDIVYRHIFDKETNSDTVEKILAYKNRAFSLVTVPEYPGVLHLQTMWGKNRSLSQKNTKSLNHEQFDMHFEYFSPIHIPYYMYMPNYLKFLLPKESI